ncbi:hypothetical protein BDZ89DRAFT_885443, partial [Hymenopellis radicata]
MVHMDSQLRVRFVDAYKKDREFRTVYQEARKSMDSRSLGKRFLIDEQDLLYFLDADFQPRLCVPRVLRQELLTEGHESPVETAH